MKIFKNIFLGFVFLMVLCIKTFAYDEIDCPSDAPKGSSCWKCSNNSADCIATYFDGKLSINGSGPMKDYSYNVIGQILVTNAPWETEIPNIKSVEVKGVSTIGSSAFSGLTSMTEMNIDSSVSAIMGGGINSCTALETLYIPDSVKSIGSYGLASNYNHIKELFVPFGLGINGYTYYGSSANIFRYKNNGDMYYVYDSQGNISAIYKDYDSFRKNISEIKEKRDTFEIDSKGNIKLFDKNGHYLGKYSPEGQIIEQCVYGDDGSVSIYDASGKLIGLQGKRILTVEEASALVKDNKNTFTLKYR